MADSRRGPGTRPPQGAPPAAGPPVPAPPVPPVGGVTIRERIVGMHRDYALDERATSARPSGGAGMLPSATQIDLSPPTRTQIDIAGPAGMSRSPLPVGAGVQAAVPGVPMASAPDRRTMAIDVGQPQTQMKVWAHELPRSLDARLVLARHPDSPRAASYRVLRHRLQERGDPRAIVVTSAEAREGKTTCAVNLAMALGECGRAKVLLVEANLRTPQLAAIFGFKPPECFGEQLVKHKDQPLEPWAVVEVIPPWLHVAAVSPETAGQPLLDSAAFTIAMERLRLAGYHYLVIDTPPVLDSADVNMVVDAADAVLLLVNARLGRDAAMRYWDAMAGYRSLARAREHRNQTPCRPSPSVRRAVTQHGTQKKSTEPSSR